MALIGGGGAGNVAGGANPSGTGSILNYIGDHVYLYSGIVGVASSETTIVTCDVAANQYIEAKLQIFLSVATNEDFTYKIKINNEVVMQYTLQQTSTELYTSDKPLYLILAPYTKLTITGQGSGSTRDHTASITGRVY
jgi:hypothetical protein